jgi:hypothetical protein
LALERSTSSGGVPSRPRIRTLATARRGARASTTSSARTRIQFGVRYPKPGLSYTRSDPRGRSCFDEFAAKPAIPIDAVQLTLPRGPHRNRRRSAESWRRPASSPRQCTSAAPQLCTQRSAYHSERPKRTTITNSEGRASRRGIRRAARRRVYTSTSPAR